MKISFLFETNDWISALELWQGESKKKPSVYAFMPAVLIGGGLLFAYFRFGEVFSDRFFMIGGLILLLSLFNQLNLFESLIPKKEKLKIDPNYAFIGTHVIDLEDTRLVCHAPEIESKYNWSAFDQIIENEDYMILGVGKYSWVVIPKKKIESEMEESQVFSFIRSKVNNA